MDADHHQYRIFACTSCGYTFQAPLCCGNRFCPVCSHSRRRRAAKKLRSLVNQVHPSFGYTFKHLTLTISNRPDLSVMHRQLLSAFRRLRQRALWKHKVRGGACTFEVTGRPGNWHLHLHAILEARYIPWSLLHDDWQKVSGGLGVWIATRPPGVICHYLTEYLTKCELQPHHTATASDALKNSRLFHTFGSWHHLIAILPPFYYPCPKCHDSSWFPLDLLDIINKLGYLPHRRKKERASPCRY